MHFYHLQCFNNNYAYHVIQKENKKRIINAFVFEIFTLVFSLSFSILVNMDDRMIEQFVDEDDFIINLDFDNQLGHFELTLQY